jgi:hypothetical protein
MSEKTEVLMARQASAVLENEAFKEALLRFDKEFTAALLKVPDQKKYDDDLRRAQMMLKMSVMFKSILIGMVESAKVDQKRIDIRDLRDETPARQLLRRVTG